MSAQPQHPQVTGPAYEWPLWSTTVRVVASDPHALPSARRLVQTELAHVELAASADRRDSEVRTLPTGRRVRISTTLTSILAAAQRAAEETGRPGWPAVELDEHAQTLRIPRGARLDVGSTALAWAADRCAAVVADTLEVGVLVSLGGAVATAGPAGLGAWEIHLPHDPEQPADPMAAIAVPTGLAVVTATGAGEWHSATVVAPDCVTADTWATAAVEAGSDAPEQLIWQCLPARLVRADGSVCVLGGWPAEENTQFERSSPTRVPARLP